MSPCVSHLNKEERLQQKVEEHVSNYFADTGEWMRFPPWYLKCQVSYILKQNGGTVKRELSFRVHPRADATALLLELPGEKSALVTRDTHSILQNPRITQLPA